MNEQLLHLPIIEMNKVFIHDNGKSTILIPDIEFNSSQQKSRTSCQAIMCKVGSLFFHAMINWSSHLCYGV